MLVRLCPPFWFLGMYQRAVDGPAALPIYGTLASTGGIATIAACLLAAITYPLAYLRRTRQLVLGSGTRDTRGFASRPATALLHNTLVATPYLRAVFHFISQTLLRIPRYRIYLVFYGGIGLSIIVATVLRLDVVHEQIKFSISADGVRASTAIVALWTIIGLRTAFISPGNRAGNWIFRTIQGRPPVAEAACEFSKATQLWTVLCAAVITLSMVAIFKLATPHPLAGWQSTASLVILSAGLSLLLTDLLFLNVKTIAFSGEEERNKANLAFTLLKFFAFVPIVIGFPVRWGPWIEQNVAHMVIAVAVCIAAHIYLQRRHLRTLTENCALPALDDDEEDFPMKLGLRY